MMKKFAATAALMMAAAMAATGCGSAAAEGSSAAAQSGASEAQTAASTTEDAAETADTAAEGTTEEADTAVTVDNGQDVMEYISEKFTFCYDPKSIESFDGDDGSVTLSYVNPDVETAGSNVMEIRLIENTTADEVLKEQMKQHNVENGDITEAYFGSGNTKSYSWAYGGTKSEGSGLCTQDTYIAVPCGEDVVLIDVFRTIGPDEETEMAVDDTFSAVLDSFKVFENGIEAEAGLANPMTEYSSLEEMNDAVMGSMVYCPNDAVTDQVFTTCKVGDEEYSVLEEYDYTLDGQKYMVRFSPDFTASISGLYGENGEEFSDPDAENYHEFSYVKGPDYYCAHWMTVDGQYIFAALDSAGMDENTFEQTARTYMDGTIRADS